MKRSTKEFMFDRKVDVYEFREGSVKISVEIRLKRERGKDTVFYCNDKTTGIKLENQNFDLLWNELDDIVSGRASIVWKKYLEVKVSGGNRALNKERPYDLADAKIYFDVCAIEVGQDLNGATFERKQGLRYVQKHWKRQGYKEAFKSDAVYYSNDESVWLVEDNEANRKAVEILANKFNELAKLLFELLSPNQIRATFQKLLNNRLLLPDITEKENYDDTKNA